MENVKQTSIRLNKEDHKNIAIVRKQMKALDIPESQTTLSDVVRWALSWKAKGGKG